MKMHRKVVRKNESVSNTCLSNSLFLFFCLSLFICLSLITLNKSWTNIENNFETHIIWNEICFNYVAIQEMEISFQRGSSEAHLNLVRQKLRAWVGCSYNILDPEDLREATLPSVWQRQIFDDVHAADREGVFQTQSRQQFTQGASGCAAWNRGQGCEACDKMYGPKRIQ